jgi:hypothetical protein|nr:MAG TPA: hypothetical protein [Caudoviricetes sp.]
MKTVFKVGMKVYDQIYEPDVKGEVLDVNLDISPHPITVKFGNCVRYYTAEGCRGRNQTRTLSTSPYRIEGFEQKAPAPTFEEAKEWIRQEYAKGNNYLMPKDTFVALKKLTILRDYYNEGWQPDWESSKGVWKHSIVCYEGNICKDLSYKISRILTFRTKEIRDKFLEEQRELLEIAKPLL